MKRRTSFKVMGLGALALVGGGFAYLRPERQHAHLAMQSVMDELCTLDVASLSPTGAWEIARIFDHLAQSVEFSLSGYPDMKSELFRSTVGPLAFSVFTARGQMRHGLDREIPGEVLRPSITAPEALGRLRSALRTFDAYAGSLAPHFAYGRLTKSDYATAHAMHVRNHFEEIKGI